MRAARATRLLFFVPPIKFLIFVISRERHGIVGKCVQHVQHAYTFLCSTDKVLICGVVFAVEVGDDAKIASLSKDDANASARKQLSDWLSEETSSCTCGIHSSTILWRSLPSDNVKFPNLSC